MKAVSCKQRNAGHKKALWPGATKKLGINFTVAKSTLATGKENKSQRQLR